MNTHAVQVKSVIKRKRRNLLSEETQKQVINRYLAYSKITDIQKDFNISETYLSNILFKNNIPREYSLERRRKNNSKFTYDNNIFKNISTEEQAYWVGFLMADGYVSQKENIITLVLKDRNMIEKFQKFVKTDVPIFERLNGVKNGILYGITLFNREIANDLADYDVIQNKTFRTKIPQKLPKELIKYFIRGYFDADGCVYIRKNKKRSFTATITSSSVQIIEEIKNYLINNNILLEEEIRIWKTQAKNKTSYYETIIVDRREAVIKFLDYIYNNGKPQICLERKLNKYLEIKAQPKFAPKKGKYSQYLGVSMNPVSKKYIAYINKDKKTHWIGSFLYEKDAAIAFNKKAVEFGFPLEKLNKIE